MKHNRLRRRYGRALTKYQRSYEATVALRPDVKSDLRPLFDHLLNLSEDSRKHGNDKRAGIELRQARKLAEYR